MRTIRLQETAADLEMVSFPHRASRGGVSSERVDAWMMRPPQSHRWLFKIHDPKPGQQLLYRMVRNDMARSAEDWAGRLAGGGAGGGGAGGSDR
jgi:hypothetical protein